jgi:hypothetical protein
MSTSTRKKTVSFSQFSNWWNCPYKWYRDTILKEKVFEDSIHMSFGTAIHETIQAFLTAYLNVSEEEARKIDLIMMFTTAFKTQVNGKGIKYTQAEFDEFVEDGKGILAEFLSPENVRYHFPRDKWELIGIEKKFIYPVINNVNLDARLDIVLKDRQSGDIRIVDLKTATNAWSAYQKEDFTKISQLLLYKAVYSKVNNIPLGKIHVEFIILKRKFYEDGKTNFEQTHIQVFKPAAFQDNILQVIKEFRNFIEYSFTTEGVYKTDARYPKQPGKNKSNCKWCNYAKNGKCNQVPEPPVQIING